MVKLLIATHNQNKFKEFQALLEPFNFNLLSLSDLNINSEVEENQNSYLGNAALKAKYYQALTGLMTLADDSGIEIEALNQLPGIYSARFLGSATNYKVKNQIILDALKNKNNRKAKYVCALSLAVNKDNLINKQAELDGVVLTEAIGLNGFGYDPIFKPAGLELSLAQLTQEQKNTISHRALAIKLLAETLKELAND